MMQSLPGFRDFLPADCAVRNYIFARWREVSRRYGFVEYDGPTAEPLALYEKKSGGELVGQMFTVGATADPGVIKGALRPEMTPTLARMVGARGRDYKKPLKWFSIPSCFRHERHSRGRLREFYQLNCDILGESASGADAEIIAMAIDLLRSFGFGPKDFVVRLSDRRAWMWFLQSKLPDASDEQTHQFLGVIDKLDSLDPAALEAKLGDFGFTLSEVREFIAAPEQHFSQFKEIADDLRSRGLEGYFEIDPSIVRGLAYYTGVVFEVFDRSKKFRAIAGGGRYDNLISHLTDGAASMPALGFAMGDVVLGELIRENKTARIQMEQTIASEQKLDVYVVVAKEERRAAAMVHVQALRDRNYRVDYPLAAVKVGKQFQAAEHLHAEFAVLYGDEWPQVKIKRLATREEQLVPNEELLAHLAASSTLSSRAERSGVEGSRGSTGQ